MRLLVVLLLAIPLTSRGGVALGNCGPKAAMQCTRSALASHLPVKLVRWSNGAYARSTRSLVAPALESGALGSGPDAAWTDLTLVLGGPLTLTTEGGAIITLDTCGQSLNVVLDEPVSVGQSVRIDFVLPDWLIDEADAAGDLVIDRDDPDYDAVLLAIEDGALAVASR